MRVISAILIFYGAILLPFKNCPMIVRISLAEFLAQTEVISFIKLYMIKVQKSKLIKIIRYDDDDDRQTDRQINLRSNTHGCELINVSVLFLFTCCSTHVRARAMFVSYCSFLMFLHVDIIVCK